MVFLCTSQLFAQNPQLKKWYLNQFEADFSGSAPQINALPVTYPIIMGGTSSARFPANSQGFYDDAGNILFYTAAKNMTSYLEYQVVNGQGTSIGSLSPTPQNSAEMTVVPFGCQAPNKYLLIYASYNAGLRAPCYSRLVYAVIDLGANTVSPSYEVAGMSHNCSDKAHAVGLKQSNGKRWLYANDSKEIVKCEIDVAQSNIADIIKKVGTVYTQATRITPVEVELSHNQNFLAWSDQGSATHDFVVINLNANGDYNGLTKQVTIPSANSNVSNATGIEFHKGGYFLYVGFHTYGTDTSKEGIYRYSHLFNSLNLMPNTAGLQKSHIELAGDGNYYAAKAHELVNITTQSSTAIAAEQYFPYNHTASFTTYANVNDHGIYRLPNQIDGEVISSDYSLPDLSGLVGAVCKDDAILNFSPNIGNYTVTVEKAFQSSCVYQGSAQTLDLTTICDIQCGDACSNSIRVTITAELCNGSQLSSQSGVFHVLCGPAAPKITVGTTKLCPGDVTWGSVNTTYPAGTTIEWLIGGTVVHTGANYTNISGSFTVRVTDANGCFTEQSVLLAFINCDFEVEKKKVSEEAALKIFPNPASDEVEVQLLNEEEIQQITVKDKVGQKVKNATYKAAGKSQKLLVNDLKEGVYVIELLTKTGKRYMSKLVVR